MNKEECLTTEIKGAYLADEISTEEREMIETHLASCRECRHQLAHFFVESKAENDIAAAPESLKEKAKQIPPQETKEKESFISSVAAYFRRQPVAIAASLVLLIVVSSIAFLALRGNNQTQNTGDERYRSGNSPAIKPKLLSPNPNAQVAGDKIEFRWEKVINALSYTLIILDEKGDTVFQKKTTEESFSLDVSALNLAKDKPYFWFVKTKLADGTYIDSDTAKFLLQNKF